jgi:hypothetical protein
VKLSNLSIAMAPAASGRRSKKLAWLIFPMLLSAPAAAQNTAQDAAKAAGQVNKTVESPINSAGVSFKSGNRRDPFLNPLHLKKNTDLDEEVDRGLPPPGIAGTYIAQAAFQGVSIRDDRRLAVIRGVDSRAYFLKVGDRLFDGYVKTIQLDSITFVRETKLKSGKTLTQDVTKKLRTP